MKMSFVQSARIRRSAAVVAFTVIIASAQTPAGSSNLADDDATARPSTTPDIHSTIIVPSQSPRAMRRPAAAPIPAFRGASADLLDAADQYTFFEGFETYDVGPLSGQVANAPPGVLELFARNAMEVVTTASQGLPPGRDPFGTGDLQHLKDARGATGVVSGVPETRWHFVLDRLYAPTPEQDLIVCMDMYFTDYNTLYTFEPVSFEQELIVTRVLQAGRWTHGLTASTEGQLTRPAVLGLFNPPFGQFYALPLDTDTGGALAPFETKTGEWFTLAVRITVQGVSVWIRDSQTDGSKGVLIEDPVAAPFLESGWCRIYPGAPAEQKSPGVWTGYGVAINEFGEQAALADEFLAANVVDAIQSVWFPDDAIMTDPLWGPSNRYMDNLCILGVSFSDCPWDLTGSRSIGPSDLGILLGCWGSELTTDCEAADFTGSGAVGSSDLAHLLSNWGPCPP